MYPYDENNNSTNTPETGSERPAEDGSYRIVKPDAEREACYRDASYTPQGEASFDGYYVPGGRGPKPPEPEKKPHKRGIGAAGVIALCLVCALLGGVSGGLIANANRPDEAVVSDEPSTEPLTQTSPAASGSTAKALAMQSLCCWPPDIPSALLLSRSFTSSQIAASRRDFSTISSSLDLERIPWVLGPYAMLS